MNHTIYTLLIFFFLAGCRENSSVSGWELTNKQGDLGNGYYLNPILSGDYPDPTILRDGEDYYMTHSCFDYLPGLVVFHSTDLVNWQPISFGLQTYLGSVWAPDITRYEDRYYIYFTVSNPRSNFVVWSHSPYGPWSEPIDLGIGNIDPCHIVGQDGTRWLFMSNGIRQQLTADGLAVVPGSQEKVYDGWAYPQEWVDECFCLEGPKLKYIDGYYYYLNAQGGTAGPPTSHMVVAARSRSIDGPWENSPYNPIVRTWNNTDRWWSKGHGSLVDTPQGEWWIVYHAYENGFYNLGRQTLLEPVEWTEDGWFKIPEGVRPDEPIAKPVVSEKQPGRRDRLGEFRIGLDWKFYKHYDPNRCRVNADTLTMKGQGDSPGTSSPILFVAGNHAYEVQVEIEKDPGTVAGLLLYYNSDFYAGTGFDSHRRYRYRKGQAAGRGAHTEGDGNRLWLRLRNDRQVVTGAYSYDDHTWYNEEWGMELSGYNHNTLYDFQSLLPALFVHGQGEARFKNLRYTLL
ncbi:MAG: family 43 glycosylhydrolase [Rikenellaceae bacterium]|nr:family 43 glycosylhydrolase [Rikenellaceae bacterium]